MHPRIIRPATPAVTLPEAVAEWAALRTRPHWEKRLAGLLAERGVPVFLPLMAGVRHYASRQRLVELPVFAGYVFCSAQDFIGNRRLTAGVQSKVVQMLRAPDPEKLRAELKAVADLLKDRQLVQERFVGKAGDRVRLVGTSFAGQQGTIVRAKPTCWKLVLEISFLGVSCEVEFDESMIERAR